MKGVWHFAEAVLAGVILVTALLVLGRVLFVQQPEDIGTKAYDILKGLDDQGVLRGYAVTENASGLNDQVGYVNFNHSIEICNATGSCSGGRPSATQIFAANYIISGNSSYQPHVVRLYLWRV